MNNLNHLAIIMDGNGRWAKSRGLLRTNGHKIGAQKIDEIAKFCLENGIKNLTLYAFSTENWKRPKSEINFLLNLFSDFLKSKKEIFIKNEIKFNTIGDLSKFDENLQKEIKILHEITKNYEKLNLNLAVNYGGRDEIIRAIQKIIAQNGEICEENLNKNLDTANFGDVDLLIRTGGQKRLSNFLLWQSSYAELTFSDTLWPDFSVEELKKIVENFKKEERKFGGL